MDRIQLLINNGIHFGQKDNFGHGWDDFIYLSENFKAIVQLPEGIANDAKNQLVKALRNFDTGNNKALAMVTTRMLM